MIVAGAPLSGLLDHHVGFRTMRVAAAVGFAVVALALALALPIRPGR